MRLRTKRMRDLIKSVSMLLVMSCFITLYPQQQAQAASWYKPLATNVRYVRDTITAASGNLTCRWTEIQVLSGDINVAFGKTVTAAHASAGDSRLQYIVDGRFVSAQNYEDPNRNTLDWVMIDLGSNYNIDEVKVWHDTGSGSAEFSKYSNPTTEVSSDGVNWVQLFCDEYTETNSGLDFLPSAGSIDAYMSDDYKSTQVVDYVYDNNITWRRVYAKDPDTSQPYKTCIVKPKIRVLNIFPGQNVNTAETYVSSVDGKTYTLPPTAAAKKWMEEPNSDSSSGYGKGLISVDAVEMNYFSQNSYTFLRNSDGTPKYDVVFIGTYYHGNDEDLSEGAAYNLMGYISAGGGVLFGKNVLCNYGNVPRNLNLLRKFAKIKLGNLYVPGGSSVFNPQYSDIDKTFFTGSSDTSFITKQDIITQYPWVLGNKGAVGDSIDNITETFSGSFAFGDVWIQNPYGEMTAEGTGEAFLSTWGNVGVIQLGDYNANASSSEKMALANALFYLGQSSTSSRINTGDISDKQPPYTELPVIRHDSDRTWYTSYMSVGDAWSTYKIMISGASVNEGLQYYTSPLSVTADAGIKGYAVKVDQSPTATFSASDFVYQTTFNLGRPPWHTFYVHHAAMDNAGNISVSTTRVNELVSITHPISVSYSIDPNSSTPFVAPDIKIVNNSESLINVSLQDFSQQQGSEIHDVLPDKYSDWSTLNSAQSKNIAIGILGKGHSWVTGGWYSAPSKTIYPAGFAGPVLLGTIDSKIGSVGTLSLNAKFGLAWDKSYTVSHNLGFIFSIRD